MQTKNTCLKDELFTALLIIVILFLNAALANAQECAANSSNDCNSNGIADECELGPTVVFVSADLIRVARENDCNNNSTPDECDIDTDADGTIDQCETSQTCGGNCIGDYDEDGDRVPSCMEQSDGTDPCDKNSKLTKLGSFACGNANGFLEQINIATVLNTDSTNPLQVQAEYRDQNGILRDKVNFTLAPNIKKDLIINDMGLQPNIVGTLCIFTNAASVGRWNGGITLYKLRNGSFGDNAEFDFALYYPFQNPITGTSSISLNTNSLGTDGLGLVANWVRVTDATPGDGKGLLGKLNIFKIDGSLAQEISVSLPDGGRADYAGHEALSANQVGLAQFTPSSSNSLYALEVTRYFYKGVGASSTFFYAAVPVPIQEATGSLVSGSIAPNANEIAVIEMVNVTNDSQAANIEFFGVTGASLQTSSHTIPPKRKHSCCSKFFGGK